MKKILDMKAHLVNDGKNISGDIECDGADGDMIKAASLCVAELMRMLNRRFNLSLDDTYDLFNNMLIDDVFNDKR